ncbi:uncharacterized protein LOC105253557 isoform X5 [Camponotus floridanus]|uniref:uncharacterized protein LOC105253557 isoform X5 n=1 Tax=Camponotus floridanus TaxID=104421 RepID=UPI000DC6B7D2|nr:uncharacterized protein LOC105253557 isoform X5 [Camponotus floridanus]
MEEEKHETLNINISSKSDEKSSPPAPSTDSPGEPSQSEIMEKKQQELLHVDISDESDETSLSPLMSTDSPGELSQSYIMEKEKHETPNVDTSSKLYEKSSPPATTSKDSFGESSQSEIMEKEQQKLHHVDISGELDEKSSSPPMSTSYAGEPPQSEIMEKEQQELLHVDSSDDSDETLTFSPTSTDSPGEPSQSEIMEEEQQKLLHVDISDESDETLLFPPISTDSPGELSQSYIMEKEKHETPNVDTSSKLYEKSSPPATTSKDSFGESSQSEIMEKEQQKLHHVDISGELDEKSSSPPMSTSYAGVPSQSDMKGEKHKSLNDDTSTESDEKSLVLWRPLAPPIQDLEEKSRIYKLLMRHVFTRESRLIFNYKRERRSSLPSTPIPELLAICPPPPESTTSELLNVIEKPNTSKSDINLDSQSSKTCSFTKQAKIKTPKDSTNESNSSTDDEPYIDEEQSTHSATHTDDEPYIDAEQSTHSATHTNDEPYIDAEQSTHSATHTDDEPYIDAEQSTHSATHTNDEPYIDAEQSTHSATHTDDEPYIDAEQSTHSVTHTDDDIRNLELLDNQEKTIEESPPECSECALILVVSLLFVALTLIVSFSIAALFFAYLFPFDPLGLSLGQNLEHTDTFTSVIVELEEKILDHDETIQALAEYLQQDTPLLKVVALINNASVDKSYTIDIIRNKFARRSGNERVSLYPSFTVLENLSLKSFKVVIDFVNMCQRVYPRDQQVTILADFKIDDDLTHIDLNRAINTLKETLIKANINFKILLYKPLNEEALEKYIQNMAENIGKSFSQIQIDDIKRHLIEGNCKKAYGHCYG